MSYDIRLVDPVTKEPLHTKVNHDMRGGMYAMGGTTELWLNITWNYAHYYYEATDGDKRFAHEEVTGYTNGKPDGMKTEYGIRGIYGKTGAESIPMLEDMINKIESTYKDENGDWKTARRKRRVVYDEDGYRTKMDVYEAARSNIKYTVKTEEYDISEGDTSNYWTDTAANALRPLHQLIAMARIRPDGVWEGD